LTITEQSKKYLTAIDYISTQSGKLNAVTNQINFLTSPVSQQSILTAVEGVQNHLSAFSTIQSYLPKVDVRLFKMWKGAIEAYYSYNSDKVRHFSTSIRELFTHLIHILAPDVAIKRWTADPAHYYEGRPTRKARLLFICRNLNNASFTTFVKKDVEATIAFIDVFQKGTHDIDPVFSENHLLAIKSKAENTLKFLLEIHFNASI